MLLAFNYMQICIKNIAFANFLALKLTIVDAK